MPALSTLDPRIATVPRRGVAFPRQVRELRRTLSASGRYDVGRLRDAQVMALASREAWEAGLADRWARRPAGATGGGMGGTAMPAPSSEPPSPVPTSADASLSLAVPLASLVWIEIEVVDEDGVAYSGEHYRLYATDGRSDGGRLDDEGRFRLDDIPTGTCRFDFPELVSAALDEA